MLVACSGSAGERHGADPHEQLVQGYVHAQQSAPADFKQRCRVLVYPLQNSIPCKPDSRPHARESVERGSYLPSAGPYVPCSGLLLPDEPLSGRLHARRQGQARRTPPPDSRRSHGPHSLDRSILNHHCRPAECDQDLRGAGLRSHVFDGGH